MKKSISVIISIALACAWGETGVRTNTMRTQANSAVIKNVAVEGDFVVCAGGSDGIASHRH